MIRFLCLALLLVSSVAHAELPDAPSRVREFALSVAVDNRYNFTKSTFDTLPRIGIDYHITGPLRVGIGYGHDFVLNPSSGPGAHYANTMQITFTYKILQWGRFR